jgi:hypothetical protein
MRISAALLFVPGKVFIKVMLSEWLGQPVCQQVYICISVFSLRKVPG